MTHLPRRVLVFAPYISTEGRLVSPHYDAPEYRLEIGEWMDALEIDWEWIPITADNLEREVSRARSLAADQGAVVFNLCDGSATDTFPGIDVVEALVANEIPYTGAGPRFYRLTESKAASKEQFRAANVPTSPWVLAASAADVEEAATTLPAPWFVKPDVSAGSYGIEIDSVVHDTPALLRQVAKLRAGLHGLSFADDAILIERFIEGREFTVLVVADSLEPFGLFVLPPAERVFDQRVPAAERFLAYERYWELPEDKRALPEGEAYYRYELAPPEVAARLADLARRAFHAVGGESYARVDIRLEAATGALFVLEVNAQCGLSSTVSSTVGSMLELSNQPMSSVVERILGHAMGRRLGPG